MIFVIANFLLPSSYCKLFFQKPTICATVILNYLCIIFTVPFPFPVLILTNQFFNSIILFFYSFEAKVKKNSFKQVKSHDRVNFQWNFTDVIQDSSTTMAGCISSSISYLWNFNQNYRKNVGSTTELQIHLKKILCSFAQYIL